MLNWLKSINPFKTGDTPVSNLKFNNLNDYYKISNDSTSNFRKGDYVILKPFPLISDTYFGCDKLQNYAYVMNLYNSPAVPDLGNDINIMIAVISKGKIIINNCDSRMFCKAPINAQIPLMLREFVDDNPISQLKVKMILRPRKHSSLYCDWEKKLAIKLEDGASLPSAIVINVASIYNDQAEFNVAYEIDGKIQCKDIKCQIYLLCEAK